MTFWKKPEFKALQKQWYQRIKEAGFEDAEEMMDGEPVLKQTAAHNFCSLDELTRDSKEAYYVFVAQKVEETIFPSHVDKIILSGVASGKRISHIVQDLQNHGTPRCRFTVRVKIRTYEMKWGIRKYTAKQLNRKVS